MPKKFGTYRIVIGLLFALSYRQAEGQFISIKDTAFASSMCAQCPSILDYSCRKMDTSAANGITYYVNFSQRKVQDAREIVYFKNLSSVNLSGNELQTFPSINNSVKWSSLLLANNKLAQLPDLSSLKSTLITLDLSNNLLTKVTGLEKLTNLHHVDMQGNLLRSLPNLDGCGRIERFDVSGNYLSFKDFIPFVANRSISNDDGGFILGDQRPLTNDTIISSYSTSQLVLKVAIDEGVKGLTYLWYKNNVSYRSTSTNQFIIDNVQKSDSGNYSVTVRSNNPKLSGITVRSGNILVKVNDCQRILASHFSKQSSCEQTLVTLTHLSLSNTNWPFALTLENALTGDTFHLLMNETLALPEGTYHLLARGGKSCEAKESNALKVLRPKECPIVFSPNGDGVLDEILLEGSGPAELVNKEGKIVKHFILPTYWDGRDDKGAEVPLGTYVVFKKEGNTQKITVLR